MTEPMLVKLPLRLRTIVTRGAPSFEPLVHCPRQGTSIDAHRCTGCARLRTLEWDPEQGGEIVCTADVPARGPSPNDKRTDFAEAAARCQLHELVDPVTVCIPADTLISDLRKVFEKHVDARAFPVVDDQLHMVSMITRADIATALPEARVSDVMPASVQALPEHSPIGYAIAMLAFEKVSDVVVVTDEGSVVGLVDAQKALRWTAHQLGYVTPGTEEAAADDPPHVLQCVP